MPKTPNALLHGSLDALMLKTLAIEDAPRLRHRQVHRERLWRFVAVEEGSLYPALYLSHGAAAGSRPNGVNRSLAAEPSFID